MILLLWMPIWLFMFGSQIVMRDNYYVSYSDIYNYTFILLLPIAFLIIRTNIKDFNGRPLPLYFKILFSILFGLPTIPYLNHLHIRLFGKEVSYVVEVYDKRKEEWRDKIHSYIEVSSSNGNKTLDYAPLYLRVDTGSKLLIKQKTSLLGYSIAYKDIQVLNNK